MELSKKIKVALEETRVLILGAQILLGFQFRGPFRDGYQQLPIGARCLDAFALGLLVFIVGLLVTPGTYHRIVERGEDTIHLHRLITAVAAIVLFPFALALGFDLVITTGQIFGAAAGWIAGGAASAVAVLLWYGFPLLRKWRIGQKEKEMAGLQGEEVSRTPLHAKIEQMLTEARVILPGAQALFGFQLAIVLTRTFGQLPSSSKIAHAVSILLVALTVVLLMGPAAYHRIVYAGEDTQDMYRVGSDLVTAATIPLAVGIAGDVYVVIAKIAGSAAVGLTAGILSLLMLIGFWHIWPLTSVCLRKQRR